MESEDLKDLIASLSEVYSLSIPSIFTMIADLSMQNKDEQQLLVHLHELVNISDNFNKPFE